MALEQRGQFRAVLGGEQALEGAGGQLREGRVGRREDRDGFRAAHEILQTGRVDGARERREAGVAVDHIADTPVVGVGRVGDAQRRQGGEGDEGEILHGMTPGQGLQAA